MRAGWRCYATGSGALYVTSSGTWLQPVWCAGSWATGQQSKPWWEPGWDKVRQVLQHGLGKPLGLEGCDGEINWFNVSCWRILGCSCSSSLLWHEAVLSAPAMAPIPVENAQTRGRMMRVLLQDAHGAESTDLSCALGLGPIHMSNVQCTGHERSLGECRFQDAEQNGCRHEADAAVRCHMPYMDFKSQVSPCLLSRAC